MSTKTLKTNGGVSKHAVDRLIGQYGFRGSVKEARRLLRFCRNIGDKTDRVLISSRLLKKQGISARRLAEWGVLDGKLVAKIDNNVVDNVLEATEFRS